MREQAEQRALNNVKRFGYHIVQIPAEGEWPQVTYSIGLHATTGQPDAMVIGLPLTSIAWCDTSWRASALVDPKPIR